jgi:starch phosphorylase
MPHSNIDSPAAVAKALREGIQRHVRYTLVRSLDHLTPAELLVPVSLAVRDLFVDQMRATSERYRQTDAKHLYYLSMEFLMGRLLGDTVCNMRLNEVLDGVLGEFGVRFEQVLESEADAGLGNGGLGRLAACFLESLATLDMPGYGYGIDYEYGMFRQEIANGFQREKPDRWKANGTPFQIQRSEEAIVIPLYGRVENTRDRGNHRQSWLDYQVVVGVPNDMPVVGYNGRTVNYLRLFQARSSDDFDIDIFNRGDYIRAVEQKIGSENISRVLYPSDSVMAGKELRLVQEYFLVACAVRDIVRNYLAVHNSFNAFSEKVAIQMNDTHPALAVAELMRVLVDENNLEWEDAWEITQKSVAYTNHTLLPEALEKWSVELMERVLPRHMQIIYAINHNFLRTVTTAHSWVDGEKLRKMSIIEEGHDKNVRMAHLAIIASHAVNGVSALHSDLIRTSLVPEFAQLWPAKFSNKTNGVAPRRWLLKANPHLSRLLCESIGEAWITDLSELRKLEPFANDAAFQGQFAKVNLHNKLKLARIIRDETGVSTDPKSMFDVQIKRIHEYKRQLLNVLRVMHDYLRIVEDGDAPKTPRTVLFAGKAAPGYWAAKQIIKLIHNVAAVVNKDPKANQLLRVAFLPDYRVSLAEAIIPAADLSEQISTAGMEASGTGNMKLMMNGAVTVATWDGANIEIAEEAGEENIYIFGLRAEQIEKMQREGLYHAREYYDRDPRIKRVMDCFVNDRFSASEPGLFRWIFDELINRGDRFFHIADLPQYIDINEKIDADFQDTAKWRRMSILNTARSHKFSSDRTIEEYSAGIWNLKHFPDEVPALSGPAVPTTPRTALDLQG